MSYFNKLVHPELFQGHLKKKKYFEGWYYKLVSYDHLHTLAFIPGISLNPLDPHAFIQVFISSFIDDKNHLETHYVRYPIESFISKQNPFSISIGTSTFSKESIKIDINDQGFKISGIVTFSNLLPLKKSLWSPNIMGPFGYLNFMECYHGIVSMNHHCDGKLYFNDQEMIFSKSKGYIEKDWGKSFPRAYVWIQSNHFKDNGTSLLFSYADIPFLGFHFKGLIVNLIYNHKEYRFSTYNFAKVKKEMIDEHEVNYYIKQGKYSLLIVAKSSESTLLPSPKDGQMSEHIKEGLSGHVELKLYKKGRLLYHDVGNHAGIEIMKR